MKFSLKRIPENPADNKQTLVQVMARLQTGDKSLSAPIIVPFTVACCFIQPQWVNTVRLQQTRSIKAEDLSKCIAAQERYLYTWFKIPNK